MNQGRRFLFSSIAVILAIFYFSSSKNKGIAMAPVAPKEKFALHQIEQKYFVEDSENAKKSHVVKDSGKVHSFGRNEGNPLHPKGLFASRIHFLANEKVNNETHREKIHQEIASLIAQEKANIFSEQDFKIFINAIVENLPHQSEMSYLKSYLVFQVKQVEDQHSEWSENHAKTLYSQLNQKQLSIVATLEAAQF